MNEILSFVDSFHGLYAVSTVCKAWYKGVKDAPVALAAGAYSSKLGEVMRTHSLHKIRASFPRATAMMTHAGASDEDLSALVGMSSLRQLAVPFTAEVTCAGLEPLLSGAGALTGLTALNISCCTRVSERTLMHLGGLRGLSELAVNTSCLGHGGAASLLGLASCLTSLYITLAGACCSRLEGSGTCERPEGGGGQCVCAVGPAASEIVSVVGGLTSLTSLQLRLLKLVSGSAVTAMGKLPALSSLSLEHVEGPIEDEPSLCHVGGLTSLTALHLSKCEWVRYRDVPRVVSLRKLEHLGMWCRDWRPRGDGTGEVADDNVQRLADALPNLVTIQVTHEAL